MRQTLDRVQVSYWFVPLVAAICAFLLSRLTLWADARIPNAPAGTFGLFQVGSVIAVRTALLGIAATILTTTGVVFSLLMVPLSVAASQFGSRLLRVYLKDRTIQIILGIFVGTFVYCLSLAISVPTADPTMEGPQISVTLAFFLSLVAFASVIVLIHNIGVILQAPNVVAAASHELRAVIRSYVPVAKNRPTTGDHAPATSESSSPYLKEEALRQRVEQEGDPIFAQNLGYIRDIDPNMANLLSKTPDLVVHFVRKPGDFIQPGDLVARAWPPHVTSQHVLQQIQDAYRLGNSRSPAQDIGYGINQLVEVALRALSPAINDPFTAMTCLDHIGAGIALFVECHPDRAYFYDAQLKLRVIVDPLTYSELLDAAFNMIRRAARDNSEVLLWMLNTIGTLSLKAPIPEQRSELARHARLIEMENQAGSAVLPDRERISRRCAELLAALENGAAGPSSSGVPGVPSPESTREAAADRCVP